MRRLHVAAWLVVLGIGLAMMVEPRQPTQVIAAGDSPLVVFLPDGVQAERISFAYRDDAWVRAPEGWRFNDYSSVSGAWMLIPAGCNVVVRSYPEKKILLVESHTPGRAPFVMWRP